MAIRHAESMDPSDSQMIVVSPTYAPDLELFTDLHRSVLEHFPVNVRHLAIVPKKDVPMFRQFPGPRCEVVEVGDVLPRSVLALPFTNVWMNWRRPLPPLRGWIVQQLVKLAVASQLPERFVVTADSDLVFTRPVNIATFAPEGRALLYRFDDGVGESLPRHVVWHKVARDLLGLPQAQPPLPDYVSPLFTYDRDVVCRMLQRIEEVTGKRWLDAVGTELHFSECTLYGVYVDECEGAKSVSLTGESLCHAYWETSPLTAEGATTWLSRMEPRAVAYMISAKSNTPPAVRRAAHASVFTN